MLKRKTTTTCEYDSEGKMIKKTIVEEIFEEELAQLTPLTNPCNPNDTHYKFWWKQPYCSGTDVPSPNLTTTTTAIN